ncbi:hypothetical protein [Endozoicomonas atrinae]|uniref:hypothetical protein n=1 Tax=Endozoicomonas atrinae TaxID=1333660 RepID=UPI003B007F6B
MLDLIWDNQPPMTLYRDLKKDLAEARDKAVSTSQLQWVEWMLKDVEEHEEAYSPIESLEEARRASEYEAGCYRELEKVVDVDLGLPKSVNPPVQQVVPTVAPAQITQAPVPLAPLFDEYLDDMSNSWKDPESRRKNVTKAWSQTGMDYLSDLNKEKVRDFKKLIQEKYSGTSGQSVFLNAQGFSTWLERNTEHEFKCPFKAVGGFKKLKKVNIKTPIKGNVWGAFKLTKEYLRLPDILNFFYYSGCNAAEVYNIKWETVEGIQCFKVTDSKTDARERRVMIISGV